MEKFQFGKQPIDWGFYFWCAVIVLVVVAVALTVLGGLVAFLGWCWRLF
jgi:hypothetical protein